MTVCKFSVADGIISVCAMTKLKIKCDGMDEDMENCPFWNIKKAPLPPLQRIGKR